MQRVHHAGIHAVPAADILPVEQPAKGAAGPPPGALRRQPFPAGQPHIFHQRRHFPHHLPPGQGNQQTVAGKGAQLGIGGHFGIAVSQVISQQAIGAIVFPYLAQAQGIHRIAHGIPYCHPQQAPPKGRLTQLHTKPSFSISFHYKGNRKRMQGRISQFMNKPTSRRSLPPRQAGRVPQSVIVTAAKTLPGRSEHGPDSNKSQGHH